MPHVEKAIAVLNEALELDSGAVNALFAHRVPVNHALEDHSSIQVGHRKHDGRYTMGVLGLINGLFGTDADGWGFIAAVYEEDGHIGYFKRVEPKDKEKKDVNNTDPRV